MCRHVSAVRKSFYDVLLLLSCLCILALNSCVPQAERRTHSADWKKEHSRSPEREGYSSTIRESEIRAVERAPWETWSDESFGYAELEEAARLVREGDLRQAIEIYGKAQIRVATLEQKRDVAFRRAGTLLKVGESKKALDVVTSFAELHNISLATLGAKEAIIIAFAYEHQGDFEQSLAWLGFADEKLDGNDLLKRQVMGDLRRIVRGFDGATLDNQQEKWRAHPLINQVIMQERIRRKQGGRQLAHPIARWFEPETYAANAKHSTLSERDIDESDSIHAKQSDEFAIGVLLPLSGRFGDYGKRIKEGIELAVQSHTSPDVGVRLVYSDTAGDPQVAANNYENLVKTEGVSVVLGPLLAETTEVVAAEAELLGVPIVAFTRKSGIPELSPSVFRLGATAKNQLEELVSFVIASQRVRRFGIVFPDDNSGKELWLAFKNAVSREGMQVVGEYSYVPGDEESFRGAVSKMRFTGVGAIFVAENLEKAWTGLEMIKKLDMPEVLILGPTLWDDAVMLRGFGDLVEGAIYVTPYFALSERPEIVAFRTEYKDRYGHEADLLSAQAYDAAKLILNLVDKDSRSGTLFRKRLMVAKDFQGVTGKLLMTDSGEIYRKMSVIKVINGEPVEVAAPWHEQLPNNPETASPTVSHSATSVDVAVGEQQFN